MDAVICKSVLEHIADQAAFARRLADALSPGGVLFLMAPDWTTCSYEFWDDPTHVRPVTLASMERLGRITGLSLERLEYIQQTPLLLTNRWMKALAEVYALFVSQELASWLAKRTGNPWFRYAKQRVVLGVFRKTRGSS